MDLLNKSELIKYLKQNGLWAKKSLGQNFLVDREALNKIVEAAELKKSDTVIEIGPGVGVLTAELVNRTKKVFAVELDEKLAELLQSSIFSLSTNKNNKVKQKLSNELEIVNADILKLDLKKIVNNRKYKLVANVPYYITAKILEKFLTAENKPELIVLLIQKEVAERICAKPGKTSLLSIAVQYFGQPEIIKIVKASSFFPEPKVESSILKITNITRLGQGFRLGSAQPRPTSRGRKSRIANQEKELFKIIKVGFHARRKTLINNLMVGTNLDKKALSDILKKMELSDKTRAQELSISQWQTLTDLTQNSKLKTQTCNSKL